MDYQWRWPFPFPIMPPMCEKSVYPFPWPGMHGMMRAAAAEREVEQLKHQLVSATQNLHQAEQMQQAPDMEQAIDILKRSSLEVELAAKEKEIAQLVEDVQRLQASVNKLRDVSSSQINKLEEELAAKNQAFKLLEEKLETQEDYEEMRRELEILKSIEFSNSSDESIESTKGKSLEMLLMEKNRALQSENTQVKVANNEISGTSGNDVNGTEVKSESPTDLSNTDKFASFLGEEIAATYQESSSSPQPESNSSTAGENTVIKDEMKVDEPALDSVDSVEMNGDVDSASDNGADMTEIHREVDKDVDTVPEEVEVDNEPEKNVLDDSPSFEINTAEVSQQIREVMSAHNIGQKHFANHVLGLSQGTLSDLLSKPKSWDQLSEKGRDWYRKMYLWCLDERNVLALKAMASRKASREYPPPEDLEAFANMYQGQNLAAYQMSNSGSEPSTPPVLPRGVKLEKSMDSSMDSSSLNGENSVLSEQIDGVALQKLQTIAQKESNNSPALNTADVSQKIREILSTHNIGQRLFAKHVLSLSQGTVSELLSKPKHWDKLTEKGRESYRKMFAWSLDGRNVMALKAISPRKGSTPITSPYKHEDSQTEERIAQILSDAQTAMQAKQAQEKVYMHDVHMATHMVNSIYQQELAKMAHNSSFNGASPYHMVADMPQERQKERPREKDKENRGHKKERRERSRTSEEQRHQDDAGMSEEIVRRIYQKELEKLAQAAQSMGNMAECRMYQQELARLAQNAQHEEQVQAHHEREREKQNHHMAQHHHPHHPMHQDIKPHLNNNHYDFHIKNEPLDLSDHSSHLKSPQNQSDTQSNCSDSTQDAARHAGSAFCLVRPKSEGMPLDASYPSNSMSPLQHMQTIANSLVSKSQMPFPPQKPLKAVLPPITQEQFDCYSTINTDDLVKRVKETLSQYSISQRLFGEHVLGLSQGSVSDLLARPKPWHMLTQKGREPFIRMQIFLEDAEAIPKLVASQYRIAPDKLMRSNAMYLANHVAAAKAAVKVEDVPPPQPPPPPPLPTPVRNVKKKSRSRTSSPADKFPPNHQANHHRVPVVSHDHQANHHRVPVVSHNHQANHQRVPVASHDHQANHQRIPVTSHDHQANHQRVPVVSHPQENSEVPVAKYSAASTPPCPVACPPPLLCPPYHPTMYELNALTNELDTLAITSQVKEVLQANNLGQRLFGEAILGLSQGSVSELLSKPKPWQMLSLKGREPFIKMFKWLNDPLNVDRLRSYQAEQKAHRKRKNHHISQAEDQSLENTNSSGGVPMKKARVFFSEEQKETLRQTYLQDPYPNQSTIEALAMQLGVAPKTVINWFHNHRMRTKQQAHPGTPTNDNGSDAENSQAKNEDGENMSDNSELSNDYNQYMHSQSREMTQWMFPSFEPVNLSRASSANSFESNHLMDNGSNAKDSDSESLCNGADGQRRLSLSASNRRKSAKPQWVYQGIQLDKSQRQDGMDLPVMSEGSDVLTTQGDHSERSTPATATSVHSHDSRLEVDDLSKDGSPRDTKIKKLQKAIERSELEWEEVDRSEKISRLEKNLHEENGRNEGWEF
ncbi:homeobox protein cut-like isoform X2 [Lineus longissimus]|uniref:homeobox protein cut-like isoform X2 n=1 Tax=Lineus longissimus TaxID=88925 RepID=UPI00315DD834